MIQSAAANQKPNVIARRVPLNWWNITTPRFVMAATDDAAIVRRIGVVRATDKSNAVRYHNAHNRRESERSTTLWLDCHDPTVCESAREWLKKERGPDIPKRCSGYLSGCLTDLCKDITADPVR